MTLPIKIKVIRHSNLEEIFDKSPLPIHLLQEYLKSRKDVLENIDLFFENVRTVNRKKFRHGLFVETNKDDFDVVVFGTYLELFEYHGKYEELKTCIKVMSEKYQNKLVLFFWNHDNDFIKYNSFVENYSNVRILNYNTSQKTKNDILLPFWTSLDINNDIYNKTTFCSYIATLNNNLRVTLLRTIQSKPFYNFFSNLPFEDYKKKTSESYFSLCPRGHGLSSYRFFECIHFGTIPVLFANDIILPYTEMIDYEKLAIIMDEKDTSNFEKIDTSLKNADKKSMLAYIEENKHHFTLEGVQEYIFNYINKHLVEVEGIEPSSSLP